MMNCSFFRLNLELSKYQKLSSMIRKLKSGKYRIYSITINPKTNKHKNLGTFDTLKAAKKHEQEIQYFKHRG